ncbi:hypothetical protein [Carnobacterium maltaromaticum]|uniref:hypothetical protein n=1 Tax=Carnobacterium maltaromaticum TaxID=2751 RepID=UPI001E5A2F49|nr:hypothetical protein [Carnobacterium maltaromaticum]
MMKNDAYTTFPDTETFLLGDTNVTIVNPVSYYPESNRHEDISFFLGKSSKQYQVLFRELAEASLNFYTLENDFNSQKEKVIHYLKQTTTKQIVADTGISTTTVSELKSGKRTIDDTSVKYFEKLYRCSNQYSKNRSL